MYQINFDSPVHVHFIGIGGISMSGLAEVLLQEGFTISGSDSQRSELTRHLEEKGATVFYGQTADNIKPGIDVVVYTAAIHPDNAEFAAARSAGIPMLTRAELLGEIMRNYKTAIAVAGTHGKTTTTSMISMILLEAQADPTISVGGILPEIGGNIRVGRSDLFLTEACEYTNSFLSFFPTVDVILNIEEDHLDFFKDLADIRHSFHRFAELLPGHSEIWKVNYETGVEECIVSQPDRDFTSPSISPDGQWLLFVGSSKIETGSFSYYNTDLFVSRLDGTGFAQLTYHAADDLSPVWSKDGRYIYFVSKANIWRMTFNY